jgi:predicted transcriptional regulator
MTENDTPEAQTAITLTTEIVSAYVANNSVQPTELPALIAAVHGALQRLTTGADAAPAEDTVEKPTPAQIRKSITPDALISFMDGKPYKTMKRHLSKHGLDLAGYRARFGLPDDYPSVSPNYSTQRSTLARSLGLGRKAKSEQEPEPALGTKTGKRTGLKAVK